MQIDPSDALPRYAQVERALAEQIAAGIVPVGHQLPPEDALIAQFDVSRTTIRKAIANLADRGLVEIQRGRGTFVTRPKITHHLTALSSFVEDMIKAGRKPTAKVIDHGLVPVDGKVAQHLLLSPGTLVLRLKRVRLADGHPLSFDETYLPQELGEQIVTDDLEVEPVFDLLEEKYALPLTDAEYQMEAAAASAEVAAALDIQVGDPVFRIERTSFSTGDRPVDYEILNYRGDAIKFVTRLQRRAVSRREG